MILALQLPQRQTKLALPRDPLSSCSSCRYVSVAPGASVRCWELAAGSVGPGQFRRLGSRTSRLNDTALGCSSRHDVHMTWSSRQHASFVVRVVSGRVPATCYSRQHSFTHVEEVLVRLLGQHGLDALELHSDFNDKLLRQS